jgi:hypothetical protein
MIDFGLERIKLIRIIPESLGTHIKFYLQLSPEGKKQHLKDRSGLPDHDPGFDNAIKESVGWICRAQDNFISQDGGVAYRYSLIGYVFRGIVEAYQFTEDSNFLDA